MLLIVLLILFNPKPSGHLLRDAPDLDLAILDANLGRPCIFHGSADGALKRVNIGPEELKYKLVVSGSGGGGGIILRSRSYR